jgi:hypothetical protein
VIYLIGSLRNPRVPVLAEKLRAAGFDVFDDWYAAGPKADDCWQQYEKQRGHSFSEALRGHAAKNVFEFDRRHLVDASAVVLVLPAGKSGHLELGWALGRGTPGYILLDGEPERYDVMYQFANGVADSVSDLIHMLNRQRGPGALTGATAGDFQKAAQREVSNGLRARDAQANARLLADGQHYMDFIRALQDKERCDEILMERKRASY